MTPRQLRAIADAARALAEIAAAAAEESAAPDEHVAEAEAARLAGVSRRVLAEARRRGELAAFGRQRSRTYRRGDVLAWRESRRAPIVHDRDAVTSDVARRVARLESRRSA